MIKIVEKDLIGTWRIVNNKLKNKTNEAQNEIDIINSKYQVTYNEDGTYKEINNGIIIGRVGNFKGKWNIEGEVLRMSFKNFAFKRTYRIHDVSRDKTQITLCPCDTLYCSIYTNIEHMIIEKV